MTDGGGASRKDDAKKETREEKKERKKEEKQVKKERKQLRKVLKKAKKSPEKVNIENLAEYLSHSDPEIRRLTLSAIDELGGEDRSDDFYNSLYHSLPHLVHLLDDDDQETKRKAIRVLSWIFDQTDDEGEVVERVLYPEETFSAIPELTKFLKHDDPEVRESAVRILRHIAEEYPTKVQGTTSKLEKIFDQERGRADVSRTYGLITAHHEHRKNGLTKRLVHRTRASEDTSRMSAVDALKTVFEFEEDEYYKPAVKALKERITDENPRIRTKALEALLIVTEDKPELFNELGPELVELLEENGEYRYESANLTACEILEHIGMEENIPEIEDAVEDSSEDVKLAAQKAISKIEEREDIDR